MLTAGELIFERKQIAGPHSNVLQYSSTNTKTGPENTPTRNVPIISYSVLAGLLTQGMFGSLPVLKVY
jgi:hypothetical protein